MSVFLQSSLKQMSCVVPHRMRLTRCVDDATMWSTTTWASHVFVWASNSSISRPSHCCRLDVRAGAVGGIAAGGAKVGAGSTATGRCGSGTGCREAAGSSCGAPQEARFGGAPRNTSIHARAGGASRARRRRADRPSRAEWADLARPLCFLRGHYSFLLV